MNDYSLKKDMFNFEDVYLLIHFQKCHSWKCQNQTCLQKCQNDLISENENDTFESVILKSVKIESVRVDRHPLW